MGRLLDLLTAAVDAWKLGAGTLLMAAIGVAAAFVVIGTPAVFLAALASLAFGVDGSADFLMLLVGLVSVPIGVGMAVPYFKEAVAEFEARNVERRRRALAREVAKYRKAA